RQPVGRLHAGGLSRPGLLFGAGRCPCPRGAGTRLSLSHGRCQPHEPPDSGKNRLYTPHGYLPLPAKTVSVRNIKSRRRAGSVLASNTATDFALIFVYMAIIQQD